MLLNILAIVIFMACLGSLWREGLWSNLVRLLNVLIAGLLATSYFAVLGARLRDYFPQLVFFTEFAALWLLFGMGVLCLSAITDQLSQYRLRFPAIIDRLGSWLLAGACGWLVVCFTFMTLHTAPLCERFLFGQFRAEQRMVFGRAPDRTWLGIVRWAGCGALANLDAPAKGARYPALLDSTDAFIDKYAEHRAAVEQHVRQTGSLMVER